MRATGKHLFAQVLLAILCICYASREDVQLHEQQQQTAHFVVPDLDDGTPPDELCEGFNSSKQWQIVAVGLGDGIEKWPHDFVPLAFEHWLESTLILAQEEGIASVDVVLLSQLKVDPVAFCGEATRMRYLTAMHYKGGWTNVMKSAKQGDFRLRCINSRLPTGVYSHTLFGEATIPDFSNKTLGDLLSAQELQKQPDRPLASFHAVFSASANALQAKLTSFTSLWSLITSALPHGTEETSKKLVQSLAQASWNSLCSGGRLLFYNEWLWSTSHPSKTRVRLSPHLQSKHLFVDGPHFETGNAYLADMLVALNRRFPSSVDYVVGIPSDRGRTAYQYSLDLTTLAHDFLREQPHKVSWKKDAGSVMGPGEWVMTPFRESIKPLETQGSALASWFMNVNQVSLELQTPRAPKEVVSPIEFYDWACGTCGLMCTTLLKTAAPSCVDYWNWVKSLLALEDFSSFDQQSKLQDFWKTPLANLTTQNEFIKNTGFTLQMILYLLQLKLKSAHQGARHGSMKLEPANVSIEAVGDPCSW